MTKIVFEDGHEAVYNLASGAFNYSSRLMKALVAFSGFAVAALVSIAIPVLHFVLVPGFLIAAFVFSYLKFNQVSYVYLKDFNCPMSANPLNENLVYQTKSKGSTKLYCSECRKSMKLIVTPDTEYQLYCAKDFASLTSR